MGPFSPQPGRFSGESPGSIKVPVVTARVFWSFGFLALFFFGGGEERKGVVGGARGWGWTEKGKEEASCGGRVVKREEEGRVGQW